MCKDTGGAATAAVAAAGLTVAKMREWVAEETGEEQLAFYTLQAKANPEDRWWVAMLSSLLASLKHTVFHLQAAVGDMIRDRSMVVGMCDGVLL